jgi:Transposase
LAEARRRYSRQERRAAVRTAREAQAARRPVAAVARELGLDAGTLRRWLRLADADDWAAQVGHHFGFLRRHGFDRSEADGSNWRAVRVTFRAPGRGVAMVRDYESLAVEVQLLAPGRGYYADDLVRLRRHDARAVLARQRGTSAAEIERQLAFWAGALREHGADFLAGDLSGLHDLDRMVRERAVRYMREGPLRAARRDPSNAGL